MQISLARPGELGAEEVFAWHSMQRVTPALSHPFMCPEFAVAVGTLRPDARVAVLSEGGKTVGFFPFQRRRFGVGVPIGAGLNDRQGLVHAPGLEWDPKELLRACKVSVWQFDNLVGGQRPFEPYVSSVAPSSVMDLSSGFAAYREKLQGDSPKFYGDLARKKRKLERDVGAIRFVADSRDLAELRILMRWKSDQYRRTGWTDRFDRPWIVDLVDYLFDTRNDGFRGMLSLLYAGETLVAAHFGLRFDETLAAWFPSYDREFRRQSPGLVQHLRMAEGAAELGVQSIDLGTGDEPYKESLKSHELLVAEGTVARGGLSSGVHQVRDRAASWARRRIKEHPTMYRAADYVLRHYGRVG